MPLFGTKMRHIHPGGGVVDPQRQHLAGRQRRQPLARTQDRQRADQAGGVEVAVHRPNLAPLWRRGKGLVLALALGCGMAAGDEHKDGLATLGIVAYRIVDAARIPDPLGGLAGVPSRGLALYFSAEVGCSGCHGSPGGPGAEASGTAPAPSLAGVGGRLDPGTLRLWLVAPRVVAPDGRMPGYYLAGQRSQADDPLFGGPRLTAQQIEDLVAYLADQRG